MKENSCKYYCYKNIRSLKKIENNKNGKIQLVVFDMDGVLVDLISSWKYIHDYFNTSNEHSVDDYLHGKIDDLEFIRRDVALWKIDGKPVSKSKIIEILADVPLMKGAGRCIDSLKNSNVKTAIVSAGLDVLADRVADELGIDYVFANGMEVDENGLLNGRGILGVRLMYKDDVILDLSRKTGVSLENIASVGNSCFDIPMFAVSGFGIAFNPEDECTCEAADYIVDCKDLSKILPFIKKHL